MKAYPVLLIIIFSLPTSVFSQLNFVPHTINTSSANSVFAVDMNDDDIDVLSTSDGKINAYNNDGNQKFILRTLGGISEAGSVYAVDIDGDGDMDVLSTLLVKSSCGGTTFLFSPSIPTPKLRMHLSRSMRQMWMAMVI